MNISSLQDTSDSDRYERVRKLIQYAEANLEHDFESYMIEISPELAEQFLSVNFTNNRLKSKSSITSYASRMKEGLWGVSAPIFFSEKGWLIDGQHRLEAVIESQTSQEFVVMIGLPDDAATRIDRGLRRSVSDISCIEGHDWVKAKHGATARMMHAPQANELQMRLLQPETLIPFLVKYKEGICFAIEALGQNNSASLSSVLSVIAKAYYSVPAQRERLIEFAKVLNKGVVLLGVEDNAALVLHRKILTYRNSRAVVGYSNWSYTLHSEITEFTQSALSLFLQKKDVRSISRSKKDLFLLE